jgi:hypothetical protein
MKTVTEPATTRKLIGKLFASQLDCARRLHFVDRTVRYWCQHGAPPHVLNTLERLHKREISLPWARKLMHNSRSRRHRINGGAQ